MKSKFGSKSLNDWVWVILAIIAIMKVPALLIEKLYKYKSTTLCNVHCGCTLFGI